MSKKNQTELSTYIQALTATHGETEYKALQDDEQNESFVHKKAVKNSTVGGTTKTLNFLTTQMYVFETDNDVDFTISNLEDGERGYLLIDNTDDDDITFTNGTLLQANDDYLTINPILYFEIININATYYVIPLGTNNILSATDAVEGIQENSTTAEAKAMSLNTKNITPSTLGDVLGDLLSKTVSIGDWNMDSTITVDIAHGLSDFKKVRSISVIVRNDDDDEYWDLLASGQISFADATNVRLTRTTAGTFDSVDFDSTSYNRGWITIHYAV
jgi:hypothetical protein